MKQFLVHKKDNSDHFVDEISSSEITEGEIKIAVQEVAFTANNITYCLLGEKFGYWKFFPAKESYGIIPAWGMGRVISSQHDEIKEGELLYGYFPLSDELIIRPGKVSNFGMVDMTAHRKELPAIYNYYEKVDSNPFLTKGLEKVYMLFKPLFGTSFLLSHFLADHLYFEAKNIVLTSASSKTALALAYILNKMANVNVIGITSAQNKAFVENLSLYNEVLIYDDITELNLDSSVIVDFAGNKKVLADLQRILLDGLKYCSAVGLSHWDKQAEKIDFPFKAQLFFAPALGAEKIKEWGMKDYRRKVDEVFFPFLKWLTEWINIRTSSLDEFPQVFSTSMDGKLDPGEGLIIDLQH